jgi:hypothetical protein
MRIYDANHPGKQIIDVQEEEFHGFLRKDDVERLLLPEDCVGIRVYNAGGLDAGEGRLIAAAVAEDGAELGGEEDLAYVLSSTDGTPALALNRSDARSAVISLWVSLSSSPEAQKSINFSSFFSKKMLEQLLTDQNSQAVDGIGFFKAPLRFKKMGQTEISDLRTHLGVAMFVHPDRNGAERFEASSEPENGMSPGHIISDQPCPGHCVTRPVARSRSAADAEAGVLEVAQRAGTTDGELEIDSTRYLVVWQ